MPPEARYLVHDYAPLPECPPLETLQPERLMLPKSSSCKPEMRMIIAQIVRIRPLQAVISLAQVSLLVFSLHAEEQNSTA
jgi:hypothetical protein